MATTYWAFPTQAFMAFDANGDPVAAAEAKIFEAGTSTPLTVYTDTALTTPHAVPQIADANGVFSPMYISGPDEIKIEVRTTGNGSMLPGFPVDNITGTPVGGLAAAGIVFTPTATLAAIEVQAALTTLDTLTQRTRNRLIEVETAGSSNAYTLNALGTITAYVDGDIYVLRADRNGTGAATLNVDSVGAKNWKRHDGSAYVAYITGEIRDGNHYWVEYDSGADEFHTIIELRRPATQAEAEAGTAVAVDMDALRVKQAIVALDPAHVITPEAVKATTSGTTSTYSSIAAGKTRITCNFSAIGHGGTDRFELRLGDSSGIDNSGYIGGVKGLSSSSGFLLNENTSGSVAFHGCVVLNRIKDHVWTIHGSLSTGAGNTEDVSGHHVLTSALTDVQLTTTGGATFDAGEWGITLE